MIDPTTQKTYPFPHSCPDCGNTKLNSIFSGAEDLVEQLSNHLRTRVHRDYETKLPPIAEPSIEPAMPEYQPYTGEIHVSTRLYDPSLNYTQYDTIVIVQAENLTASVDYLVNEEVHKQLFQLTASLLPTQTLILDTAQIETPVIQSVIHMQENYTDAYNEFLQHESEAREHFQLPPQSSLIVLTSQEKSRDKALEKIKNFREILQRHTDLGFSLVGPYPAKMLKRKNYYSYHLALKVARKNEHFGRLRIILLENAKTLGIQVRLNPKHLF